MTARPATPQPSTDGDPAEMMRDYGIERVPVDVFHWNGFRYSSLKDAVAAARRARSGETMLDA